MIKNIVYGVLVLVIAMFVFSFLMYPEQRVEVKSFFSDIFSNVKYSGFSNEEPRIVNCADNVKESVEIDIIKSEVKYSYKLEDYRIFSNKSKAEEHIRTYVTSRMQSRTFICGDYEEYIVFRVSFNRVGSNQFYIDKYTKLYACDDEGNLLELVSESIFYDTYARCT